MKAKYLILIGIACFIGLTSVVYSYSGNLLFGNLVHSAQSSHSSSDMIPDGTVPEIYKIISKEKDDFSIIEYPVIVQDRYNPFPFYQSVHQKKILNGYFLSHALKKKWKIKKILASRIWPAEIVLSRMENNKINFSKIVSLFPNFIDLYDIPAIRNSGARYIILHKDIKDEIVAMHRDPQIYEDLSEGDHSEEIWQHSNKMTSHFEAYYKRYLGEPEYENKLLIVFRIG